MKTNSNSKLGKKIIALLIMLSLVLTTGTFAYWASYVEGTDTDSNGTFVVGSGNVIETEFNLSNELNSGGLLVPVGHTDNSNTGAVEAINLAFDVQWAEDEETSQTLGVNSVGDIEIEHEVVITLDGEVLDAEDYASIYALVNVAYDEDNVSELTLDASATTFAFQITLDEPADQEEYNVISTATISVTFTYTIDTDDIESTDVN